MSVLTKEQLLASRMEKGDHIFDLHHHHDLHDTIDVLKMALAQSNWQIQQLTDFCHYCGAGLFSKRRSGEGTCEHCEHLK